MEIKFRYEPSTRYSDDSIEIYANDAPIGTLSSMCVTPENLEWHPDDRVHNIKFQFRNENTFLAVVNELKNYKNKHGFKYLTIWKLNHGYAEIIDSKTLSKAGFKHLPDMHPSCMFLE